MLDLACEHVGDGLDPAMGMPGETGAIVVGVVVPKIVEEQKRIEFGRVAKSKRALQLDARALEVRFRMKDALYGPDRHESSPFVTLTAETAKHAEKIFSVISVRSAVDVRLRLKTCATPDSRSAGLQSCREIYLTP